MCICSFLVWKNACLNYREFDLEGDLVGVPHTWYLSAQSFITLLKLIWGDYDIVAMNEWKKKCVDLHRTWVSKRTVYRMSRLVGMMISCTRLLYPCEKILIFTKCIIFYFNLDVWPNIRNNIQLDIENANNPLRQYLFLFDRPVVVRTIKSNFHKLKLHVKSVIPLWTPHRVSNMRSYHRNQFITMKVRIWHLVKYTTGHRSPSENLIKSNDEY